MDFRNFGCDAPKISLPRKAKKTLRGVKKGEWYMAKDCKHAKNESGYACKGRELMLQQVANGVVGEKHRKFIQFATLFHTLKHGKPMLEYGAHKELFDFLNLEENPKMHWTDSIGWAMVQHMHNMIFETTIVVQYISLTCDEVNTVSNQNWLLVHAYVV
jgi:hypothetical protein